MRWHRNYNYHTRIAGNMDGSTDMAPRCAPVTEPWRHSHAKIVPPRPHLHAVAVTGRRSHQRYLGRGPTWLIWSIITPANPADTKNFDHHTTHTAHGGEVTDAEFFFFSLARKIHPGWENLPFFWFFVLFRFSRENRSIRHS